MNMQKLLDTQIEEINYSSDIQELSIPAHLPGIDIDKGLKCLNGDKLLYSQLLIRFADDQRHSLNKIRIALDMDDFELANRIAHTLKGLAGNIGATKLQRTADVLERALSKHQTSPSLLEDVGQALQEVTHSITHWGTGQCKKCNHQPPHAIDFKQVMPIVRKIKALIREDDTEALDELEKIKSLLNHSIVSPELNNLERNLTRFDFETALIQVDMLTDALNQAVTKH
jgi:HPt (histidine-containing phosphotransfer) domain-containing protein